MDPAHASLSEALDELCDRRAVLLDAVFRAQYALWAGSGISRERFPGLASILKRLLAELSLLAHPTDPNCPYRRALTKIARHASVPCPDYSHPPEPFLQQLCASYSRVLEEDVHEATGDRSLVFDVLDLPRLYGDATVEPDAEHRFIALLLSEAVIPRVLTTNWDALIERAYAEARDSHTPVLPVVVAPEDLDGVGEGPRIVKFHGCAPRATSDPGARKFFIATQTQIGHWNGDNDWLALRDEVRQAVRMYPALLVGLSAQDVNIQMQFQLAVAGRPPFSSWNPPRAAFAQLEAGEAQERILRVLYGVHWAGRDAVEIEDASTLALYGKPLLGTLYFELVFRKLHRMCDAGQDALPPSHVALTRVWLDTIKARLVRYYDSLPAGERWSTLARCLPAYLAHALSIFRYQSLIADPTTYVPLSRSHLADEQGTAEESLALLWFAVIDYGEARGEWCAEPPRAATDLFHAVLTTGVTSWRMVVLKESSVAVPRLEAKLTPEEADRTVVVHPTGSRPWRRSRGIHSTLPSRAPDSGPFEIWFSEIASEPYSPAELVDQVRLELLGVRYAAF